MSEVEMNEDELFNSAVSDETTDAPIVTEEPVVQEQVATPEEPAEPEAELEAEKPAIPPKPEWRLKEDAERARNAEADLANERAEKAVLRQRLEALERPAPKAETKEDDGPDPLLDPKAYKAAIKEEVRQELLNDRRESSMATAHGKYKQEFEEAMSVATKQIDAALKARMQNSRDPGETLIEWHRENKVKAEVGHDPNAWLEKKMEERLKDPAFLAKAVEMARGITQPPSNGRPRIDLPPSLNGASRSGSALRSADGDVSDHELFEQTIG